MLMMRLLLVSVVLRLQLYVGVAVARCYVCCLFPAGRIQFVIGNTFTRSGARRQGSNEPAATAF